ncbi:alpha/beta hydrolase [Fulvivirga sediminis]|uniref:Alpha/beta hydrolase n=1 Tax=Fulvivirga sediminis TaxID=2803949 RepID=A0A937K2S1_9BACT|nr:alpha/beta hydrolase [Fulvivirga sediminis]MBL3658137.1 alpha/beta hydrolase [Fulvivirga sediminis]
MDFKKKQTEANLKPGDRTVPERKIPVPHRDISERAQEMIAAPYNVFIDWNLNPPTKDDWSKIVTKVSESSAPAVNKLIEDLGLTVEQLQIGGVKCYRLTPENIPENHRKQLVIVAHGGAYVYAPGIGSVREAAMFAAFGGYTTISVDYSLSYENPFPGAIEDMIDVWRAILTEYDPRSVAMTGTSAGGGLIMATILKIKELGLGMPAAIAPSSPWADLTETGDSYKTNEWLDNILVSYSGYLGLAAKLYANGNDLSHPLLSPINGNLEGFPPTILTSGTRDLFLSNTVRSHRKLRRARVPAQLHIYEGISHSQLSFDPDLPETREAYGEIAAFFDQYLIW